MQHFRSDSFRAARYVGAAAAVLMAAAGPVAAKARSPLVHPVGANQYYGLFDGSPSGLTPSQIDHRNYERGGTRGREGLGASPLHPEGPGNVTD